MTTIITEEHLNHMAERHRKTMEKLAALKSRFSGVAEAAPSASRSDLFAAASADGTLDAQRVAELRNAALRDEALRAREDLKEAMQVIHVLEKHLEEVEVELAQRTSLLRAYNREASVARIEARVAEAREVERASLGKELEELRGECMRLRSENGELRASKKKLREALERLKEKQ